jgi:hypothetical protein
MVILMKRRASICRAVMKRASAAFFIALLASSGQARIVEVSGSGEFVTETMIQQHLDACATWPPAGCAGVFYTHKVTQPGLRYARSSDLLQAIDEQQEIQARDSQGDLVSITTNNPPYEQVQVPWNSPVGWEKPGPTIPAGQWVSSHYIWLNSATLVHDIATFKFDGPIIGLIGGPADLYASNANIGFSSCAEGQLCVNYTDTQTGFVNEPYPFNSTGGGQYPISGDIVTRLAPAVLRVDFTSAAGDYVRVVTAADVPLHPGDFDHDYDVDEDDRLIWMTTFHSTTDYRADANGDDSVDAADYIVWRQNTGYSYTWPPPGGGSGPGPHVESAVPEPSSLPLLLAGYFGSLFFRRHRSGWRPESRQ